MKRIIFGAVLSLSISVTAQLQPLKVKYTGESRFEDMKETQQCSLEISFSAEGLVTSYQIHGPSELVYSVGEVISKEIQPTSRYQSLSTDMDKLQYENLVTRTFGEGGFKYEAEIVEADGKTRKDVAGFAVENGEIVAVEVKFHTSRFVKSFGMEEGTSRIYLCENLKKAIDNSRSGAQKSCNSIF